MAEGVGAGGFVLRALAARDEHAWRALHEREFPFLYRFALGMGADPDLAEDCASESFVRFLKGFAGLRLETESAIRAWLLVVCRNYLRDQLRRHVGRVGLEAAEDRQFDEDPVTRIALRSALAALPESQREVLVMRFVLDMPTREIAELSGRGVKAVESLQHRALESLRRSHALGWGGT